MTLSFFVTLCLFSAAASYQCTSSNCKPPGCRCASTDVPGGISPKLAPQFVTLSFDDGVQYPCFETFQKPLLCPSLPTCGSRYRATIFVATDWSDYYLIHQFYTWGNEIADHTMAHDEARTTRQEWYTEIEGARQYLNVLGKVPLSNITGFRTPFLNPRLITYLGLQQAGGFTYDSSLADSFIYLSSPGKYIYPFTLDYGSPIGCTDSTVDPAICTMKLAGIWEVPLTALRDFTLPSAPALTLMDLSGTGATNKLNILKANFLAHYNGNRAPFHLPLHCSYSASPENLGVLNEFYDWAHAQANVFFVTYSQLIAWMRNPVPASQVLSQKYMRVAEPVYGVDNCDGLDNNKNGIIDEGLVSTCTFPQKTFTICSTCCPAVVPLASFWTPSYSLSCPASPVTPSSQWPGCSAKPDGFYADPTDLSCYHRCVGYLDFRLCCAAGLHWDETATACSH